jgi:nitrogen-specific signal transduction histidine kinase
VLDDAPTALLTVDHEGKVELTNKAARRLLVKHKGVRAEDFAVYGDAFAKALSGGAVGRPRLVPLVTDGLPQTVMVSAAIVQRLGGLVRVVAVQPIQGELNAVEIAAQSDLIRVLTHEIMNSITPVTSLAHTAADLIASVDCGGDPAIVDARAAVETLARRADGVMSFVESYRQISRAPQVKLRSFEVLPWVRELETIFRASDAAAGVTLTAMVDPPSLTMEADPDLLCQVLINLLRNAAEAARAHSAAAGRVAVRAVPPHRRGADRRRRQRPGRARGLRAGRVPALLHHQGEGHRRRPQPRPPGRARPPRLHRRHRRAWRRRTVPDGDLVARRGRLGDHFGGTPSGSSSGRGSARVRLSRMCAVSSRTISMARRRRHCCSVMQFSHLR